MTRSSPSHHEILRISEAEMNDILAHRVNAEIKAVPTYFSTTSGRTILFWPPLDPDNMRLFCSVI